MSARRISRIGVVRELAGGCAIVEVGVPCGGCSQAGCAGRRESGLIRLAAAGAEAPDSRISGFQQPGLQQPGLKIGEQVRLSLPIRSLTLASLATFGPVLVWLALTGLVLTAYGDLPLANQSLGPLMFGCGMVGTLLLGGLLGRKTGQALSIDQQRLDPATSGSGYDST